MIKFEWEHSILFMTVLHNGSRSAESIRLAHIETDGKKLKLCVFGDPYMSRDESEMESLKRLGLQLVAERIAMAAEGRS